MTGDHCDTASSVIRSWPANNRLHRERIQHREDLRCQAVTDIQNLTERFYGQDARQSQWQVSIYTRKRDSNCFAENAPLKLGLAGRSVSIWVPIVERRQAKSTSSECGFSGLNSESFGSTKR